MEPIVEFNALLEQLNINGNCASEADVPGVIDAEIGDYITFFNQRLDAITAFDWGAFLDIKEEALSTFDLVGATAALNAFDAADRIHSDAVLLAVDRMRAIAYDFCQNEGWHYPLSRMTSAGFFASRDIVNLPPQLGSGGYSQYAAFTDEDIFADLQRNGTSSS